MGFTSKMLTAVVAGAMASAVQANDRAEASFTLSAQVAAFCKIDAEQRVVGVGGAIGAITEVCNTPGYSVRADFLNLVSGEVVAGDERATLADDGAAVFTSPAAQRRVRQWQLASAVRVDPAAPVVVRFSITPL